MNTWEYRSKAVIESDDFCDVWNRSGLNFIFCWRSKFPKFKISLFAIPGRVSKEMIKLLEPHNDFIELLVHGFNHESNFENYSWDYDKTMRIMERVEGMGAFKKYYKSPGWCITPGYNGYPADEKALISKDPQAIYKALRDRDYVIFDRHYNKPARPEGCKIVCVDDNPIIIHSHTWPMETGDKESRNGFQQIEEEHGVPWDQDTEFYFVSEAWEKGLFQPCKD
jgi:hypothetical protein